VEADQFKVKEVALSAVVVRLAGALGAANKVMVQPEKRKAKYPKRTINLNIKSGNSVAGPKRWN
jgi:hypothetical protein